MPTEGIIEKAIAAAPNRRRFLSRIGLASAALAATGGTDKLSAQGAAPTDADILNFALNLEYLEAEFYTIATTGRSIDQMGIAVTGSGTAGASTGGKQVDFGTNSTAAAIARNIAADERAHVNYLRTALTGAGATPVARPAINLNALGVGFNSLAEFLTLARAFEDLGVSAYGGAAGLISDKNILVAAARIHGTENQHAANVRLQIAQLGISVPPLDGMDVLPPPAGSLYFSVDNNALTLTRPAEQVLYIAFGNKASATSGGFFPSGVNGNIRTSGSGAVGGLTASVTPGTSTVRTASVVLDASASASTTGSPLTYMYMVSPGGLVPAILQRPNDPKATIQFTAGPGVYNLQLRVMDANGNAAITPVTLTYQP